ncbi:MAG: GNAT family N-acetyltransferase [Clostridiales bacterium]|nr:GNAT family N-acetyltransferase [Clostridiales bacterium]
MITRDGKLIGRFENDDVFKTRVSALYASYGDRSDCGFYVQKNGRGQITAVISDVDKNINISCLPSADISELKEFLYFIGCRSLMCRSDVHDMLGFDFKKVGFVVEKSSCSSPPKKPSSLLTPQYSEFSYKSVYKILKACGFELPPYYMWLSDIALRAKHKTAGVYLLRENGTDASTVSELFIAENAVMLGAVGTLPSFRGMGLAGQLVTYAADKNIICGRRAELLCEEKRLSFYLSLGFNVVGEWKQ